MHSSLHVNCNVIKLLREGRMIELNSRKNQLKAFFPYVYTTNETSSNYQ